MNNGTHTAKTTARPIPEPQAAPAKASLGAMLLSAGRSLVDRIVAETKERPRVALGIAVGVGFVLGGGLWTRAGRTILLTGAEYAVRRIATS